MIAYDGPSQIDGQDIIGILTFKTENRKIGKMDQLWILPKNMNPLQASRLGCDRSVCGDCPLRHANGGACYVNLGYSGPANVWKAYMRGKYGMNRPKTGKPLRLGAYGDPAALPFEVVSSLLDGCRHTAYTHMWRTCDQRFKDICMASCETLEDQAEAKAMGWRTFRIVEDYSECLPSERPCLADSKGKKCSECLLCRGGGKGPDIVIKIHGTKKNKWVSMRRLPRSKTAMITIRVKFSGK